MKDGSDLPSWPFEDEDGDEDKTDSAAGDYQDLEDLDLDFGEDTVTEADILADTETEETKSSKQSLPWIYSRDSVQDGRVRTVQLHLQSEANRRDREFRAELQARSSENLKKADFREALFLAGLDHLDEAIDILEDWGYEFD